MHVLWIMLAKTMNIKYFNVETWMLFAPPHRNFWLRTCTYCNSNLRYINVACNLQPPTISYIWEAVVNSFLTYVQKAKTLSTLDCTLVAENHASTYWAKSYRLHNWYNCPNEPFATSHACFLLRKSRKSHTVLTLLYVRTVLAFTTKSSSTALLQSVDTWRGLVVRPITATSCVVSNHVLYVIGLRYGDVLRISFQWYIEKRVSSRHH